jgi:DNA-binding PadR family transcriptional regulator
VADRSAREPETPLTPAVFHVLLALADGARHGYAILQSVEASSGQAMGPGTVYGTLQRLEEAGLVQEAAARDDGGERRRRYYAMTAAGRKALRAEARRLIRMAELVRAKRLVREAGSP